jgi:hypothetical protein
MPCAMGYPMFVCIGKIQCTSYDIGRPQKFKASRDDYNPHCCCSLRLPNPHLRQRRDARLTLRWGHHHAAVTAIFARNAAQLLQLGRPSLRSTAQ